MHTETMKNCVYCGSAAVSSDHVPPKCIIPDFLRDNLVTVPACNSCNNGSSKDDDYFCTFLAISNENAVHAYHSALYEKVIKRLFRKEHPGLAIDLRKSMIFDQRVWGPHVDRLLFVSPSTLVNEDRIRDVVNRIARGLQFKEFGDIVCESQVCKCLDELIGVSTIGDNLYILNAIQKCEWKTIGIVMSYRVLDVSKIDCIPSRFDKVCIWQMRFYNTEYWAVVFKKLGGAT